MAVVVSRDIFSLDHLVNDFFEWVIIDTLQ